MKYGIQIRRWQQNTLDILLTLGVDFVQVPLHIMQPPLDKLEAARESGIKIYGKLIPDFESWTKQQDRWHSMVKKYGQVLTILDIFGEPETRPGTNGCRWAGSASELKTAVETIRGWIGTASPQVTLTGCGWAAATHNPFFGNDDRICFFDEFLSHGGGPLLDVITLNSWVHGYGGRKNIRASVLYAQYLLAKYGEPEKRFAVSETGAAWEMTPPRFLHTVQTPEEQANLLVKNLVLFASMGCEYVSWFCLDYQGWGLLRSDGSKTPAFATFKKMTSLLKNSRYITQIKVFTKAKELSDMIEWHVFEREDGSFVSVVWSELWGRPLVLNRDFEYPLSLDPNLDLKINEQPQYIDNTNLRLPSKLKGENS